MEQFPSHPEEVPTYPGTTLLPKPRNPLVSEIQRALAEVTQALSIQKPGSFPIMVQFLALQEGKSLLGLVIPIDLWGGGVRMELPSQLDPLGTRLTHGQVVGSENVPSCPLH